MLHIFTYLYDFYFNLNFMSIYLMFMFKIFITYLLHTHITYVKNPEEPLN